MSERGKAIRGPTAWHPPLYDRLSAWAPPTTEVRNEVPLSQQPQRADLLLLRRKDIALMGWRLDALGNGYAHIAGAWYTTVVAFIDEVCEAERGDYLRLFSRHPRQSREALRWLNTHFLRMTTMDDIHELEGYDELVERLLSTLPPADVLRHYKPEDMLHHLKPEERLAGLAPEQRLAGLAPEDVLRHYGLDMLLRHLRDLTPAERAEAERKLPPDVLQALRTYVDEP